MANTEEDRIKEEQLEIVDELKKICVISEDREIRELQLIVNRIIDMLKIK